MKLLTLNIWNYTRPWPARRDAIVGLISTLQPDVVAMQEVRHDFRYERGKGQAEQLAELTGYRSSWMLTQAYIPILRIDEGLAILTRGTPHRAVRRRLEQLPRERQDENHRGCLGVEVTVDGTRAWAFCSHFSLSPVARVQNARDVAAIVEQEAGELPAFVMGDLNEPPDGDALRFLTDDAGFDDLWARRRPTNPGFTYASWHPYHRIDFVLGRNLPQSLQAIEVVGGEARDGVYPSDHLGILVDVALQTDGILKQQ